jgi:hypothetical protein
MEASALRRVWAYSALAVLLGLLLVLVPLITLLSIGAEDQRAANESFSLSIKKLEGSRSDNGSSTADAESLALSFIIVVVAFMFLRRRRPQVGRRVIGQLPY